MSAGVKSSLGCKKEDSNTLGGTETKNTVGQMKSNSTAVAARPQMVVNGLFFDSRRCLLVICFCCLLLVLVFKHEETWWTWWGQLLKGCCLMPRVALSPLDAASTPIISTTSVDSREWRPSTASFLFVPSRRRVESKERASERIQRGHSRRNENPQQPTCTSVSNRQADFNVKGIENTMHSLLLPPFKTSTPWRAHPAARLLQLDKSFCAYSNDYTGPGRPLRAWSRMRMFSRIWWTHGSTSSGSIR